MASYHCTIRVGTSGKGAAHAAYISREGKYEAMLERGQGEVLEHIEHGNMPLWAATRPLTFWEMSDAHERKNGSVYREAEVALPRELNPEQRLALVHDFIRQQLGNKHAFTFAIHWKRASLDGGEQPHAHIMWSERTRDEIERDPSQYFRRANKKEPAKGGCVKDSAGTKDRLVATRQLWAEVQNKHLAAAGHQVQVDHRSLKDQGLDRPAEQHLGPRRVNALGANQMAALRAARVEERQHGEAQRAVDSMIESDATLRRDAWRNRLAERRQNWTNSTIAVAITAHSRPGKATVYRWKEGKAKGFAAVLDFGDRLKPAGNPDKISDAKISAMLDIAVRQKKWQGISISGAPEFRKRVCDAALARGLTILDPDLQSYVKMQARKAAALELEKLTKGLEGRGMEVRAARSGGQYRGSVEYVGRHYAVHDIGRNRRVLHELSKLPPVARGDDLDVFYRINSEGVAKAPLVKINGRDHTDRTLDEKQQRRDLDGPDFDF